MRQKDRNIIGDDGFYGGFASILVKDNSINPNDDLHKLNEISQMLTI